MAQMILIFSVVTSPRRCFTKMSFSCLLIGARQKIRELDRKPDLNPDKPNHSPELYERSLASPRNTIMNKSFVQDNVRWRKPT